MSSFTAPLVVEKIGERLWKTTRPFRYYIGEEGSEDFVDVPDGFTTDFASIPRVFWVIVPPDGQYTQAAVLHDFVYTFRVYDRKKCDDIFLEAMDVLRVPKWQRYPMYWAVRLFGELSYKN